MHDIERGGNIEKHREVLTERAPKKCTQLLPIFISTNLIGAFSFTHHRDHLSYSTHLTSTYLFHLLLWFSFLRLFMNLMDTIFAQFPSPSSPPHPLPSFISSSFIFIIHMISGRKKIVHQFWLIFLDVSKIPFLPLRLQFDEVASHSLFSSTISKGEKEVICLLSKNFNQKQSIIELIRQ